VNDCEHGALIRIVRGLWCIVSSLGTQPAALQNMSLADLFTAQLDELAAAEAAREARMLQRIQRCKALAVELNDGVDVTALAADPTPHATTAERLASIRSLLTELDELTD
jgi:hypothetical protein